MYFQYGAVSELVKRLKPPARFEGYVPEFSVEKPKFSLEYRTGPRDLEFYVVKDGSKYQVRRRRADRKRDNPSVKFQSRYGVEKILPFAEGLDVCEVLFSAKRVFVCDQVFPANEVDGYTAVTAHHKILNLVGV